ncbi:Hypothetical predicted protein [Paramuricea clavata]|uniref:Uncharacterized protein n=1 Tax=Paramuricea clavata TaxID=317549 RepID=A0A7D9J6S4_PARCT|nr:Hypothetical predicted protein [Paramuricea clavata]
MAKYMLKAPRYPSPLGEASYCRSKPRLSGAQWYCRDDTNLKCSHLLSEFRWEMDVIGLGMPSLVEMSAHFLRTGVM